VVAAVDGGRSHAARTRGVLRDRRDPVIGQRGGASRRIE
jgi:hypothetical protein